MRLSVPAFVLSAAELVNARFEASSVCRSSAGKKLLFHPGSAKSDCPKYLDTKVMIKFSGEMRS